LIYWNAMCRAHKQRCNAAWRRYRRTGREIDYITHQRIQAIATRFYKGCKRTAFESFTSAVNSEKSTRQVWQYVHRVLRSAPPSSLMDRFLLQGRTEAETKTIVTDFYSQAFAEGTAAPIGPRFAQVPDSLWSDFENDFTRAEFFTALTEMRRCAPGPDNIT